MEPAEARPTHSERLMLPADALVLGVVIGAVLVLAKSIANIPAPWIDSTYALLLTMIIASIIGAGASWFIHRGGSGVRGLPPIALGMVAAVAAVVAAENVLITVLTSSPEVTTTAMSGYQGVGAGAVIAILIGCAIGLPAVVGYWPRAFAIARLAGLALIALLILFRFLPETQASAVSAQTYAVLGLTTITGALAVTIGDAVLDWRDKRAASKA